jgi:hypothetical protein
MYDAVSGGEAKPLILANGCALFLANAFFKNLGLRPGGRFSPPDFSLSARPQFQPLRRVLFLPGREES